MGYIHRIEKASTSLFFLIAIVLFCNCKLMGQEKGYQPDPKAQKKHDKAHQFLLQGNFQSAEKLLKNAVKIDSGYISAYMMLATVYKETKNHKKRRYVLKQVIDRKPDFPNPYYNLGADYYSTRAYDKCIPFFEKFIEFPDIQEHYASLAKQRIQKAKQRKTYLNNPVPFDPESVGKGVNTKADEYWPAMTADRKKLYFTRKKSLGQSRRRFSKYDENIFVSHWKNEKWEEAHYPKGNLNSKRYNEGALSIAPDGSYMLFTGCHWRDSKGRCDLYKSEFKKGRWTAPKNLGSPINTPSKETQPSISYDGNTIYFASDRGRKRGRLDIFKSKKQPDGTWSEPESLGKPINTKKTQQSPFIHPDNETLYFSSNDHQGLGGSDLYYSRRDSQTGKFGEPQNLGYPINSREDEFSLFVTSDGSEAYFASKFREGEGGMDIFKFDLYDSARPKRVTYMKGTVEDALTHKRIKAEMEFRDLENGEVVFQTESDPRTGKYLVPLQSDRNYAVNVSKKGYLFYSDHIPLKSYDSIKPYYKNIKLSKIRKGKKAVLENIFFELDSHKLKSESKVELKKLIEFMSNNPGVRVEIRGHTDNQGTSSYNQELSEKRAESVKKYLVNKGSITSERLSYKGFGQDEPIETNETAQGRAANRRTEFKILGTGRQ